MRTLQRRLRRLYKTAQAFGSHVVWSFPGRKLRVIGVTGTDGKTTTVQLIVTALESAGYTVGAVSTIHYQVGTKVWPNTSKLTTPGPWELAKLLAHMVRAGCHYVVLECSSQRLDQNGLWGIPVDVAVITNITREHFDYHRTFEDYAAAKRRLFSALRHFPKVLPFREHLDRGGRVPTAAVVNLDDERCVAMLEEPAEEKYGFTVRQSDKGSGQVSAHKTQVATRPGFLSRQGLAATRFKSCEQIRGQSQLIVVSGRPGGGTPTTLPSTLSPLHYVVRAADHEALLTLKLPGAFNLQNALAAIAVGVSQGIELARITRELSEVERIPGRMERVDCGQPFTVLIDYAVTPAAFAALYAEIRRLSTRYRLPATSSPNIIHVFGAAGERDRGKRPLLGEIAGGNADLVILTDEDPFGEDPEQILNDIEHGLKAVGSRHEAVGTTPTRYQLPATSSLRIRDRRLAIREALRHARPGDLVLVTGKGAEETMAIGPRRIPWNDRRVIEEELRGVGLRQ